MRNPNVWQYIINRSTSRKEKKKDELTVKKRKKRRLVQSMHDVNKREKENKK